MADTQFKMDTKTGNILPVIDSDQVRDSDAQSIMQTYGRLPITLVKGSGVHVWDASGKQFLDFLAGIAVNGVGHCHPTVVRAIQDQAATLIHTSNLYYTQPGARLAEALKRHSIFDRVFFCNSGAEANEAAIKIARKYGKQKAGVEKFEIVSADRSFHGRTLATVTATGQEKYQTPFAPLPAGFVHVPYNDEAALTAAVGPQTCAVLLEPIQGESGVYPASKAYLDCARALCDKFDALLIFDEIQTGMGRTGHWWAYEHFDVKPDVITSAKALGGGVPIGALLARGASAEVLVPGDHGTTFGGNPLAASAALAVIDVMETEHLVSNAHAMGAYFLHRLSESPMREKFSDVRAVGLMIGVDLVAKDARRVQSDCLSKGLILNAIGDSTLRLLPPLIVQQSEVDVAISILQSVL